MEDNRKKWITPQLIVLGRGAPEENVLQSCKTLQGPVSPASGRNACGPNSKGVCKSTACKSIVTS
jgi:hypothetical protein